MLKIKKKRHSKPFVWAPLSKKQLKILSWWADGSPYKDYDGVIADGAVRSGKTISMAPSFVLWAMTNFDGVDFALCGKTIGSLRRNVINTLKKQILTLGYKYEERRTDNLIIVYKGDSYNNFYLFGGKDESSQDLIQGMTLAGVFFDEVALMPYSFVDQAMDRCSIEGAKYWFNCNPKNPNHWFKTDFIDKAKEKRFLYLHFTMDDNLTLSEKVKLRYKRMFAGVFYKRNVEGLWVTAEGRIYTTFDDSRVISYDEFLERYSKDVIAAYIGVDFGGNKSATSFTLTLVTRSFKEVIIVDEWYHKEELTPKQLETNFVEFVTNSFHKFPQLHDVYCDSAEQILISGLKTALLKAKYTDAKGILRGYPIMIHNALKNEIIDRIRFTTAMFGQDRLWVVKEKCPNTISAFDNAVWDEEEIDDVRLDDGNYNIDSLDSFEYSIEKQMKIILR